MNPMTCRGGHKEDRRHKGVQGGTRRYKGVQGGTGRTRRTGRHKEEENNEEERGDSESLLRQCASF
jgi:hypothetical protein